jgi:TolA-binding protein
VGGNSRIEMKKLFIFCLFFVLFTGCGEKNVSLAPLLQEIDKTKKTADSALAVVTALRNSLPQIESMQKDISKYQEYIDFLLSDPTASRLDDAEVQLAYLTEAFRDLYSQVREIRLIPFIQQQQRTAPRPGGFSVSTATQTLGGDEYSLYSRGLDAYRKKFYDETRQFMTESINSFPNGKYGDRANVWVAESYIEQKNFKQALEFYQKVLGFSGSSKEDDAQYRIGICYLNLGEFDKAVEELTKLVRRYPASEFVDKANDAIEIAKLRRVQQAQIITPANTEARIVTVESPTAVTAASKEVSPEVKNDEKKKKEKKKK